MGGPEKAEKRPIIVTQTLLEWMGFQGRKEADKQLSFSKVLKNHNISYEEIDCTHPIAIEYPCVQKRGF